MPFNLKNYNKILENIEKKKKMAKIIAISKNHPKSAVIEAINKGVTIFGENRVQEAQEKFADLKEKQQNLTRSFN